MALSPSYSPVQHPEIYKQYFAKTPQRYSVCNFSLNTVNLKAVANQPALDHLKH